MRTLHLIPRFVGGGPERHLLALFSAWRKADFEGEHEIAVMEPPLSAPLLVKARRLGVRVVGRADDEVLDEAIERADLVSIEYWNHPRLLGAMRRPWPAARVLATTAIRGTTRPQVTNEDLGGFADHLIASSPRTLETPAAESVRRRGGLVDWSPALADMSRLDGYQPRPHQGIRIGHVGLIDPAKLHPRFAELCAAVARPEVHFDVFGPGRLDDLRNRFDAQGLADRAIVHGPVEDLAAAFAELDAIGHPLAPEGYATSEKSVQEAMWAGLPVVVLAGTGPADLIRHEIDGLVATDEQDYPRQVERLVDDPSLLRRLGDAAKTRARALFDPDRNARRLRSLFESMLGHPKRAREPLPGRGESAARRFVRSMGELAGPFAISLDGLARHHADAVADAERQIAASSAVVAQGEGGVVHHRNDAPDDPHLRLWSGLIAEAAGRQKLASAEFAAAAAGGVRPVSRRPR
ncbi:MAG: glycosyltransferase family 4 protein [Phycisphaerales bacterium]